MATTRGQRRRKERQESVARARGRDSGMLQASFTDQMMRGAAADQQALRYQQGMMGQYADMARGQGPSLAQQQAAASTQQTLADQMAMSAAASGGNMAGQAQQIAGMGAAAQMASGQQAAQIRSQEQMAAMQAQGQLADSMRSQAQQQQLGMGQLAGQAQMANRAMDQQHMNNMHSMFRLGGGGGGGAATGVLSGILSDERAKQGIEENPMAASQAVGAMTPKTWEYKPGYGPPGERAGITVQELEQTPAGRAIVQDTPYGKQYDVGGMTSLLAAHSADVEQRMRKLEQGMGMGGAKR